MELSELIKQYRRENKLSQREFARNCGLSHSLISLIEMGRNPQTNKPMAQDLDTYKKLADGMGITLQSMFETIGNTALVNTYFENPKKMRHRYIADALPVEISVDPDPEMQELMRLWDISTPLARKAAIELLRIMSEGKEES